MGFVVGDHPADENFEVLQALVGVARGVAVEPLEVFDAFYGDVTDRVSAEEGLYLFHGPADRFVISLAFVQLDEGEIVGDDIVEPGVADDVVL